MTENLDVLAVDLHKHVVDAHSDNVWLDLAMLVELYNQMHVSKHLFFQTVLDFTLVEHVQHLLVEFLLVFLRHCSTAVQTGPASAFFGFDFEHLIELLFAPCQQQFAEVHFNIFFVLKLVEERNTEFNVDF